MPSIEMTTPAALPADWRDFLALTKPRVMSLVVFSGLAGMLVAPVTLPLALGFTATLCIALGAGAFGALNQWYEADLDAKMRRTAAAGGAGGPAAVARVRRRSVAGGAAGAGGGGGGGGGRGGGGGGGGGGGRGGGGGGAGRRGAGGGRGGGGGPAGGGGGGAV